MQCTFLRDFQGGLYVAQKLLVIKWLLQNLQRARFHGADSQWNIGMPRHDDDGKKLVAPRQLFLQLQPVHAGHADISDNASGMPAGDVVEQHLRAGKFHDTKARQGQDGIHPLQDQRIIVDDENCVAELVRIGCFFTAHQSHRQNAKAQLGQYMG